MGISSDNLKLWDEAVVDTDVIQGAKDAQIHDRIMEEKMGYEAPILENGKNCFWSVHWNLWESCMMKIL